MRPIKILLMRSAAAIAYPAALTITNPGAESAAMTGWTQDSGGPATAINTTGGGYPGANSGSYYFFSGVAVSTSVFSQTINIPSTYNSDIDAGLLAVELRAYQKASVDTGSLILECIDSGTTVLASYTALQLTCYTFNYYLRAAKIAVPSGTRKIRIGTTNVRVSGSDIDSSWDDFTLSLTNVLTLWTNSGGTGNRSGSITVTATNIAAGASAPSALVDGSQSNSYWWTSATGDGTGWLTFDFGTSRIVDAIRWWQDTFWPHAVWRFEGSPDNSTWTQLGVDFDFEPDPPSNPFFYFPNSTAYRYYRLRHMSGGRSSSPFLREIDFRIY